MTMPAVAEAVPDRKAPAVPRKLVKIPNGWTTRPYQRPLSEYMAGGGLRAKLEENASYFRKHMEAAGFDLVPGHHPIIPVMLGEAKLAQEMAAKLLQRGIYVIGFFFPVVPKGKARIRAQMSAAHTPEQLDTAIAAFIEVGKELGVIS